ncbi:MAG: carboxypeptidase-like regulatory domain-containing protein [Sedimentisphaerales bacterium]|jgi:protocatechuate 3,4-dioxygenase beta subunit
MWTRLVFTILTAALWCGVAFGEEAEKLTFKGKVVDINGQPTAGAMVRLYERKYNKLTQEESFDVNSEQSTKEDGAFSFTMDKNSAMKQVNVFIAEKEGFALGWRLRIPGDNQELTITLGEPNELAGAVVDANGQAIINAEVGIFATVQSGAEKNNYLSSLIGSNILKARTDEAGRFVFKKIPSGARAEFVVKRAGRATVTTFQGRGDEQLKYITGQTDIKIIMPVESVIEGKVVEKETQKGVAGVRVILDPRSRISFGMQKPVESDQNGVFRMDGLSAGKMTLLAVGQADKPKEWVAEPVEIMAEEGKTTSGVEIKVSKGGLLEAVITEAGSKKPISQAQVNIRRGSERQYFGAQSDSNGLAQTRLTPGEYVIEGAYHRDYSQERKPTTVTIEEGKTVKITLEMNAMPKLRGMVRDSSGKPVEGAECRISPIMNISTKTDANGRFEMAFNKQSWGSGIETFYVVVLAKKENLAWVGPVEEEVNQMEIKLAPAIVYTGKVVDSNGAVIAGAKVTLMARFGNYGSSISDEKITSDKNGRFELKCIPEGLSCSVSAQASGYSKEQVEAEAGNIEDGRVDIGEFQLKEAPLTVMGIVVDVNDAPVANVRLYCYGQRQPDRSDIITDTNGRFTIDKVCEGSLQISANTSGEPYCYGQVQTEGGATDVKIVISEQGTGRRLTPKKSPSITGKAIPAMDGFGIKPAIEDINDKPLLICFFDVQQRPSRHALKELAVMTAGLKEKGIIVAGVQSSSLGQQELDEQLKKAKVTFAVGMIRANEEKVKSQWEIDGLPWLILTNKQHIVKASGFVVVEITEKLEGLDK